MTFTQLVSGYSYPSLICYYYVLLALITGLFAPIVSIPDNGIVLEGDNIRLTCVSTNNRPGTFRIEWYNPAGGEPFSTFPAPQLTNVQRDQAGDYTCRLTSSQNEDFLEGSGTLIVNCKMMMTYLSVLCHILLCRYAQYSV